MNILIKSAKITDPESPFHGQTKNIFISNGIIKQITDEDKEADFIIQYQDLHVSPGWFDMRVSFYDPGYEEKEDINTGSKAAAAGGFTGVATLPVTNPLVQTKDMVHYIYSRTYKNIVNVYPIAALSENLEGEAMTELLDLYHSGAKAYSDGHHAIWNSGLLIRALQYLKTFNGILIQNPDDNNISGFGQMNEGVKSTWLGLNGIPGMAEWLTIERDLNLLDYAGGKIHFSRISTSRSVSLIREAKNKGYQVTCDVAIHNLIFNDNVMEDFNTFYKVKPPFREKEDIEALWQGLNDGTIDVIVSDHNPQNEESKNIEFDLAEFGVIGLESLFGAFNTYKPSYIDKNLIIEKLCYNPRKILNLPLYNIDEEQEANLTLFSENKDWTFDKKYIFSKSKNSPFTDLSFKGAPIGIINKDQYFLNHLMYNE